MTVLAEQIGHEEADVASAASVAPVRRRVRLLILLTSTAGGVGQHDIGPHAPYRQSLRMDLYAREAARLLETGAAYRC